MVAFKIPMATLLFTKSWSKEVMISLDVLTLIPITLIDRILLTYKAYSLGVHRSPGSFEKIQINQMDH